MSVCTINEDDDLLVKLTSDVITLKIDPSRGNIFTSLIAFDKEWIHIIEDNYHSMERPKCGCPVLFPFSGNNEGDRLKIGDVIYKTGIHGVVHTNKWDCIDLNIENNYAQFQTRSSEESMKQFPFEFRLVSKISVSNAKITYEVTIFNDSDIAMPCDLGFHPFFLVSGLEQVVIDTTANVAYDPIQKEMLKEDFLTVNRLTTTGCILLDQTKLVIKDREKQALLRFENESGLHNFMLWSGNPNAYLVVEPLSGIPNAINEDKNSFLIRPMEHQVCRWSVNFERVTI